MKILYFDISAIIILVILMASLFFRKLLSGRANKILELVIIDVLITAIFDCWAEVYSVWLPVEKTATWFRYLLFYGYFVFRNLTPFLYQLFLCAITDTWHILWKRNGFNVCCVYLIW